MNTCERLPGNYLGCLFNSNPGLGSPFRRNAWLARNPTGYWVDCRSIRCRASANTNQGWCLASQQL